MMRIVFHYAMQVGAAQNGVSIGVDLKAEPYAYTKEDKQIRVAVHERHFDEDLSNILNMRSTLKHEKFHTEENGKLSLEELRVTIKQMQDSEFEQTTFNYKKSVINNLKEYREKVVQEFGPEALNPYRKAINDLLKLYDN